MGTSCILCKTGREQVFTATLLGRHEVAYFFCDHCGLLQTETPYWLDEAYSSAIAQADTGLVLRNQAIARRLAALLYFCFDRNGVYTDAAGGYGLLTRLMRDIGFDFYWQDEYCENLLARGFEAGTVQRPMTAVTAFEVMEHVPDPQEFVAGLLQKYESKTLIFSTELFEGSPPAPDNWWYYTLETGQHISFFQRRTLEYLAERLSLRLYTYRGLHVLTRHAINPTLFRLLTGKGSWFGRAWAQHRMQSKTFPDHEKMLDQQDGSTSK